MVVAIRGDKVRLGIECPRGVVVLREELVEPPALDPESAEGVE
jgi:sRNA-binding carbon storage regulator CsrA